MTTTSAPTITVVGQGQSKSTPWFADVLRAFAWPLFLGGVLVFIFGTRKGRFLADSIGGRIGRVGAFGLLELDFSRDRASEVQRAIEFMFRDYRSQAIAEFEKLTKAYKIAKLHDRISTECISGQLTEEGRRSFRSTIYVQDLVFDEALYQLMDYRPAGGGKGRIIPRRLGLVGRAFRSERSLTQPSVPGDVDVLVVDWGMTRDEAARKNERHSFSCVLLKEADVVVGGIYVDSKAKNAFMATPEKFEQAVEAFAREIGLVGALSRLTAEVASRGAAIGFLDKPTAR